MAGSKVSSISTISCVRALPDASSEPDLIVIPARFGSKRLPGKPLIAIAGRTLLERVVHIAERAAADAGDCRVLVATDDERIMDHAAALGCPAVMTPESVSTGSGRACAALAALALKPAIVVNLQGDAPFIPPAMVVDLLRTARSSGAACTTPIIRLDWPALDAMRLHKHQAPFSGTTCLRASDGRALWFSKTILPAIRDEATLRATERLSPVYRHLGLYAYRLEALQQFEAAPPTRYEELEGLEQLRLLETGLFVQTVEVAPPRHAMSGIDAEADVALAEDLIARWGDPFPS